MKTNRDIYVLHSGPGISPLHPMDPYTAGTIQGSADDKVTELKRLHGLNTRNEILK